MKGLIVSSGSISDYSRLQLAIDESDFVICADGGVKHLLNLKKFPDLVLGDLDFINQSELDFIRSKNIPVNKFSSIKDKTDTELAMDYLIDREYKEITLMGVTGNRLDHTMANLFLLNTLHDKGIKGRVIDDNNMIYLIEDYLEIEYLIDSYVSIIPINKEGIRLSLSGFFYNLDNIAIPFGSTNGVSNRIVDFHGKIKIHSGKALIFISKD